MEIELKYMLPSNTVAEKLWRDEELIGAEMEGTRETLPLHARYYDTEDRRLAAHKIAYRIRREGDDLIATLKGAGKSERGLHQREEINASVSEDVPDLTVFGENELGQSMMGILKGAPLSCIVEMNISRRRFCLHGKTSVFELALDEGVIKAGGKETRVLELEIELLSGSREELLALGNRLQQKYDLKPGGESKFARGMKLLQPESISCG